MAENVKIDEQKIKEWQEGFEKWYRDYMKSLLDYFKGKHGDETIELLRIAIEEKSKSDELRKCKIICNNQNNIIDDLIALYYEDVILEENEAGDYQKCFSELREKTNDWLLLNKVFVASTLKNRFGDVVVSELREFLGNIVRNIYIEKAMQKASNSIVDLIQVLWEPQKSKGQIEYTSEAIDNGIQLKCTKCSAYEKARELGITEWMVLFACSSDYYIVEGFNPKMGFKRTKTLMEGHDCCDNFYYMKE